MCEALVHGIDLEKHAGKPEHRCDERFASFVGLIAPHIAFLLLGRRGGPYLPLCGLVGGVVLLCADLLARSLSSGAELPLSIFTVLFAAPVLVALLCRRGDGYGGDA